MKILLVILLPISVKIRHLIQKIYEISIPPGSGDAIEAIFPEEGTCTLEMTMILVIYSVAQASSYRQQEIQQPKVIQTVLESKLK